MYYTYILYSEKSDKIYIGYTSDLDKRLKRHNSINSKGWSKKHQPWIILFSESFETIIEAVTREKYYKSHAGREKIRRYITKNID
jgi:putative endonuclease